MPQRSSRWLASALVTGYAVVASVIGGTLLLVTAPEDPIVTLPAPPPRTTTPADTTATAPTTATTTPPAATTAAASDFEPAAGPGGVTSVFPKGWPLTQCPNNGKCVIASDPAGTGRWVRIGADPTQSGTLLAARQAYVPVFARDHKGYNTIRIEPLTHRGLEAVDWEFEYDLDGVRRHLRIVYWRKGGTDYYVYASSRLDNWSLTQPIFDEMLRNSGP